MFHWIRSALGGLALGASVVLGLALSSARSAARRAGELEAEVASLADLHFALGDELGAGSDKTTYAVKDDPSLAISVVNRRPGKTLQEEFSVLAKESSQLRILSDAGVPVVDTVGYGIQDGHAAVITKRYATAMKAPDFEDSGYRFLNETSVRDLEQIRDTLASNKIIVRDLQFLVASDGHVVVADPLRIFGTETDPRIPGFKLVTRVRETPRNFNFMFDMAQRSIDEMRDAEAP